MKTELLLKEAFERDEAGFAPAPLEEIHGRVASRRRRNRGALAAAVMALIAGVGMVMGPLQNEEPSAVFVSDELGEDDDSDGSTLEGTEPAIALGSDGEPSTFVPIEDPAFDGRRPNVRTVVSDGDGGFLGMFFLSPIDERGPTMIVSRSDDGDEWDAVGRWELGYSVVDQILPTGTGWLAVVNGPHTAYGGQDETNRADNPKLAVALSEDLETWTHHDVPLNLRERAIKAKTNLENVVVTPTVLGGGRHDGVLAVQVAWYLDVAWELQDEGCGSGRDNRGVFLIRCDGSIDVMLDAATMDALGVNDVEWYVADGDEPLAYVGPAPTTPVRLTPSGFVAMNDSLNELQRSTDGLEWETVVEFDDPGPGEWYWSLMADDAMEGGSEVILAGGSLDSAEPWFATVDVDTGEVAMGLLPLPADISITDGFIDHGPAGWAAVVTVRPTSSRGVTQGDYSVVRWPTGVPAGDVFVVAPTLFAGYEGYRLFPTNELVEMGLFGELRIGRPGTDEVLFDDVNWRDLDNALTPGARPPAGDIAYESDGWSLTGDPFYGPLVVTGPDGDAQTFADGFVFTNGDLNDSAELIGKTADRADEGSLAFFADGDMVWSVAFADLVEAADVAEDAEATAKPGDAWVLRSDDGIDWEIAWSEEDAGLGNFPQIIVGDDEVVIRRFTSPDGLRPIPLDN